MIISKAKKLAERIVAEFGAVGFVCLAGILITLGASARPGLQRGGFWAAFGLVLVLVHFLIDCPFRCPAILLIWIVVLSTFGKERRSE